MQNRSLSRGSLYCPRFGYQPVAPPPPENIKQIYHNFQKYPFTGKIYFWGQAVLEFRGGCFGPI